MTIDGAAMKMTALLSGLGQKPLYIWKYSLQKILSFLLGK